MFNPELDGKGKVVSSVREKFKPKAFAMGNQIAKAFEAARHCASCKRYICMCVQPKKRK